MSITLVFEVPCHVCGFRSRGYRFSQARVNKRSLRETATVLIGWLRKCAECGEEIHTDRLPSRLRLDPESSAKVAEYRRKRGWEAA